MSRGTTQRVAFGGKPMRKCESAGIARVVPRVAIAEADQADERCRVFPQMLTLTTDLQIYYNGVVFSFTSVPSLSGK